VRESATGFKGECANKGAPSEAAGCANEGLQL
jgi:hypothetical protein